MTTGKYLQHSAYKHGKTSYDQQRPGFKSDRQQLGSPNIRNCNVVRDDNPQPCRESRKHSVRDRYSYGLSDRGETDASRARRVWHSSNSYHRACYKLQFTKQSVGRQAQARLVA